MLNDQKLAIDFSIHVYDGLDRLNYSYDWGFEAYHLQRCRHLFTYSWHISNITDFTSIKFIAWSKICFFLIGLKFPCVLQSEIVLMDLQGVTWVSSQSLTFFSIWRQLLHLIHIRFMGIVLVSGLIQWCKHKERLQNRVSTDERKGTYSNTINCKMHNPLVITVKHNHNLFSRAAGSTLPVTSSKSLNACWTHK